MPILENWKTGPSIWTNRPEWVADVESLLPPPSEIASQESCGSCEVATEDTAAAAAKYREIKKLRADWPVRVTVVNTRTGERRTPVEHGEIVSLPTPEVEIAEE